MVNLASSFLVSKIPEICFEIILIKKNLDLKIFSTIGMYSRLPARFFDEKSNINFIRLGLNL